MCKEFRASACHVWAIDGFIDAETAHSVNDNYSKTADRLKTANSEASRKAALKELVDQCRTSESTDQMAKIYGGFRRGQKAPEHMWLEYDGFIYDTMPDEKLMRVKATAATRSCPGLENEDFRSGAVFIEAPLTIAQLAYLKKMGFVN